MSWARVLPGALLFWNALKQYDLDKTQFTPTIYFFERWSGMQNYGVFSLSCMDPVAYLTALDSVSTENHSLS
jgi:hypothetical protein